MTELRPALNALEHRVLHNVPRHKAVRSRDLVVALINEDPDTIRRTLRTLAALGYLTQAGGWWKRT